MKNVSEKMIKNHKGITLLVLVITIVILIILSTVTISAVFGDGGLIEQSKQTHSDATNMMYSREENMNKLMQEYSNMMDEEEGIENPNLNDIENPDQNEIVDPGTDPDKPTIPEGWDEDKVEAVESGDGETVPVPKGYVASKASNENTVIGGFVIYEGEEDVTDSNVDSARTSRNQFVWVPVEDINDIAKLTSGYDTAGRLNYQGKLYSFSSSGATEMSSCGQGTREYREPDIVKNYDNVISNMKILELTSGNAFQQQLQLEFNEMIESIDIYGGFYIGRYETGNLVATIGTEPVVVKGNNSISNVNWYYMYRNIKELATNNSVKSTMIWGCLWDRTLIWLAETNQTSNGINGKSYAEITNSRTWGNYDTDVGGTGKKQISGYSEAWKANNIYDMAGNVLDWTLEARSDNRRIWRGGYYGVKTANAASVRTVELESSVYSTPSERSIQYGCRATIYITP